MQVEYREDTLLVIGHQERQKALQAAYRESVCYHQAQHVVARLSDDMNDVAELWRFQMFVSFSF